ncbi:MAG: hypothetical protein LBV42_01990 [Methanobrevibacter sp.]|nr:hypothetical protein [Methanobrevibacter sp.]
MISDKVIFKKDSGEKIEVKEKFVGLKIRKDKIMSINFRCPENDINPIKEFFGKFKGNSPFKLNIGETGDIPCYFKGISPVLKQTDEAGFQYYFVSVTAQELGTPKPKNLEDCECFRLSD